MDFSPPFGHDAAWTRTLLRADAEPPHTQTTIAHMQIARIARIRSAKSLIPQTLRTIEAEITGLVACCSSARDCRKG